MQEVLDFPKKKSFTVILDKSKIEIFANCYVFMDCATYAFFSESDDEISRKILKGYFVTPIFEIPRKLVLMIYENNRGLKVTPTISKKKKIALKPIPKQQNRKKAN